MTYLATEMLLYLLSAAAIGLALGWMIWGVGRHRKLGALRSDLMVVVEKEKAAHQKARLSLERADAERTKAVEAAKADADRSLAELRQTVDEERGAAKEAQAAFEQVRTELEDTVRKDQASGKEAIDRALRTANAEKAAAAEALAKEAQSRAQIEELRLLVGAEKLAAESARAELFQMRSSMQATLEAERGAHAQAKVALDDIRSTLARTFGPAAVDFAAENGATRGDDGSVAPSTTPFGHGSTHWENGSSPLDSTTGSMARAADPELPPFSAVSDMAAAGDALNNPDLDEADIEDREDVNLDLSSSIERSNVTSEPIELADPAPPPVSDRIELRPLPAEPVERNRPAVFHDRRPEKVDDLLAIDGIDPELERRLHDCGCYHYRQLACLTSKDVDWLAKAIHVDADRIAADRWIEQAKAIELAADDDAEDGVAPVEQADRSNAAS